MNANLCFFHIVVTLLLCLSGLAGCGGDDEERLGTFADSVAASGSDGETGAQSGEGGASTGIETGSVDATAENFGVELLGRVTFPEWIADVWGAGDYAYVAGGGSFTTEFGFYVVDLSDPKAPRVVQAVRNIGLVLDVKVADNLLVTGQEDVEESGGIGIFDVRNPAAPVQRSAFRTSTFRSVHNVFVKDQLVYAAEDEVTADLRIIDVHDPENPTEIGHFTPDPHTSYLHDVTVVGNVAYASWLDDGFYILDVSDPAHPVELAHHNYPGSFTHNAWPTQDGAYLLTTDEIPPRNDTPGGFIRIWDIRDYGNIEQVATYASNPDAVVHNVVVSGDYAYIAYYAEGLVVLDISDPTQPRRIAHYDTFPDPDDTELYQNGRGFVGAWGVYPFSAPYIVLSDISEGLFIFRRAPSSEGSEKSFGSLLAGGRGRGSSVVTTFGE
ncbi:MAG: choice-of-anchor B family protein [Deltaproteobacteria bacterium]|nr:MAG: choice-of-anchor B family protein [Deltaproteobacteria bacterium]